MPLEQSEEAYMSETMLCRLDVLHMQDLSEFETSSAGEDSMRDAHRSSKAKTWPHHKAKDIMDNMDRRRKAVELLKRNWVPILPRWAKTYRRNAAEGLARRTLQVTQTDIYSLQAKQSWRWQLC